MSVEGQRFGRTPVEDIGGVGVNVRDRVEDVDALREERHRMESFVRYCLDTHGGFQSGSWAHTTSVGFCAECAGAVEVILGATRVEPSKIEQEAYALARAARAVRNAYWVNIYNPDERELDRVMDVLESMLDRWNARTQERS